jgi:hypothetical protein
VFIPPRSLGAVDVQYGHEILYDKVSEKFTTFVESAM